MRVPRRCRSGAANLAVRAAAALARATGRRGAESGQRVRAAVRIEIRKRIPVAAGLAGGSADAAGALVACNELWRTGCSAADLSEIGATLGSDVPFALAGETAVGIGRGEQLTRALVIGQLPLGARVRRERACRRQTSTPPATGSGPPGPGSPGGDSACGRPSWTPS